MRRKRHSIVITNPMRDTDDAFFVANSQSTYDKLLAEVPKYKMITVSILCDRLRITCSLARKGIAILLAKGMIKPLVLHSNQHIYTTAAAKEEA